MKRDGPAMKQERDIKPNVSNRSQRAEEILAEMFSEAGWAVRQHVPINEDFRADLLVTNNHASYVVEVKVAAEGRSDRLIPLWSQPFLQASRVAASRYQPLAVVAAPHLSPRAAEQVLNFAERHAP